MSVTYFTSEPSEPGLGKLAVIFFYPRNEKLYKGTGMTSSISRFCSNCVAQQVTWQQKPEGVGSMYTLDFAELANCMSKGLFRGLLVAKAKSHIVLAGGFALFSRPATCFPSGHMFAK